MNEMARGVRADVGDQDLRRRPRRADSERKRGQVQGIVESIPGAEDVSTRSRSQAQPVLADPRRPAMRSRATDSGEGMCWSSSRRWRDEVGQVRDGHRRFDLVAAIAGPVRAGARRSAESLWQLRLDERIPLSTLARVEEVEGPSTINARMGQAPHRRCKTNVRGTRRGLIRGGGKTAPCRGRSSCSGQVLASSWGGQFENYERARERLYIVVPMVLVSILGLLYVTYRNIRDALRCVHGSSFRSGWRRARIVAARHGLHRFPRASGSSRCRVSRCSHWFSCRTVRQRIARA
jgi:cobalt-zinc-cadmium resistance protein CzcA